MLPASNSVSSSISSVLVQQDSESVAPSNSLPLDQYKVIRRNGSVVAFEPSKISIAMTKAFIAVNGGQGAASARVRELVERLTVNVVNALVRRQPHGGTLHIEDIQDQVELSLMRSGEHDVARSYVLYREQRSRERSKSRKETEATHPLNVKAGDAVRPLDVAELAGQIQSACVGLGSAVDAEKVLKLTLKDLYDGVAVEEVRKCSILSARTLIEHDPAYSFVTARLLLNNIFCEVLGQEVPQADMAVRYVEYFPKFIKQGIEAELLNEELGHFDLQRLAQALDASRDLQFNYLGLQT